MTRPSHEERERIKAKVRRIKETLAKMLGLSSSTTTLGSSAVSVLFSKKNSSSNLNNLIKKVDNFFNKWMRVGVKIGSWFEKAGNKVAERAKYNGTPIINRGFFTVTQSMKYFSTINSSGGIITKNIYTGQSNWQKNMEMYLSRTMEASDKQNKEDYVLTLLKLKNSNNNFTRKDVENAISFINIENFKKAKAEYKAHREISKVVDEIIDIGTTENKNLRYLKANLYLEQAKYNSMIDMLINAREFRISEAAKRARLCDYYSRRNVFYDTLYCTTELYSNTQKTEEWFVP